MKTEVKNAAVSVTLTLTGEELRWLYILVDTGTDNIDESLENAKTQDVDASRNDLHSIYEAIASVDTTVARSLP